MTRYELFVNRWKDCTRCDLHQVRKRVVLARGKIPCDIVFVGEAPGESEDKLGIPFIGPAGKLLDQIIERSVPSDMSYSLTNMVCCIPRDIDTGNKASEPLPAEVKACSTRLIEFLEITKPKLLVAVGALARDYLTPGYKHSIKLPFTIPMVDITHPAALLRANLAMRGLAIQRCIVTITNAVEEYLSDEEGTYKTQ